MLLPSMYGDGAPVRLEPERLRQLPLPTIDGLYVIDGSAISANPGVNPSLTITTLAEVTRVGSTRWAFRLSST